MGYKSYCGILAVGLTASYVIYKFGKTYLVRRKYKHIPGPPTKGIYGYFFGNVIETFEWVKRGKIFPDFLVECHEKYGEVFKFQFLDEMFIVTTNREAIRDILITKNYPKFDIFMEGVAYPLGERFVGIGLLTESNHERWRHRRSLFNPGFHKNILMTFIDQFNSKVDILSERLRTFADGKTIVPLAKEFNHTALDAIAQIAFGMNIDSINNKDSDLSDAISGILKILDNILRDPLFKYKWSKRNDVSDFKKFLAYVRKIGREKILERVNDLKNKDHIPNDILSNILKNWKDEDMDLEAMIDDFITFFIAGQETTANTLAFCFLELGKNKNIFLKAREEIDRVLGERTFITYQDTVDLKYCSSIFKESLRLFPAVPIVDRHSLEEMNINGINIPANTTFSLSTYINGRCEKYFPKPLEFKPERFMKNTESSEGKQMENYTYFPFSLGPRNCIGQNFAQIEGVIILAKLIQKFDFELDPNQSFTVIQDLTLRPKDGTRCTLKLRSY